tara:strand:+ start:254 stop:913 length:660 start_codon:yes stop_codon:yes gene_type:complete
MAIQKDEFWADNITILFRKDRLHEFFPNELMTIPEQLNSLVRLSFYVSVVIFLYNKNYLSLYIGLLTLLGTYTVHNYNYRETMIDMEIKEVFDKNWESPKIPKVQKIVPTVNNPFMNILLDDYKNPNRKIQTPLLKNNNLQEEIKNKFENNLYKDVSSVYERNNSQRQYYTNPITTIPNDQKNFAQWLYGNPKTCKEGNSAQCVGNLHSPLNAGSRIPA